VPIFLPSIFLPNPKHGNKMRGKNMERLSSCPQFSGRIPILVVSWSTGKGDGPGLPPIDQLPDEESPAPRRADGGPSAAKLATASISGAA
jgi:hypothetical protein